MSLTNYHKIERKFWYFKWLNRNIDDDDISVTIERWGKKLLYQGMLYNRQLIINYNNCTAYTEYDLMSV